MGGRDRIRSKITQKARNQRILLSSSPASIFTLLENLEEYYAGAALRFEFVSKFCFGVGLCKMEEATSEYVEEEDQIKISGNSFSF